MFPNYKTITKHFLWCIPYKVKVEDDWRDICKELPHYDGEYSIIYFHGFCGGRLRVGHEDGRLFKYCPKCMVKAIH